MREWKGLEISCNACGQKGVGFCAHPAEVLSLEIRNLAGCVDMRI